MIFGIIGWLGATSLATCSIPLAWHVWRTKNASSYNWLGLNLWIAGEFFMTIYALHMWDMILLVNYGINLVTSSIIAYVKVTSKGR